MIDGKLLHPDILQTLGRAGHSSQILIADGNYPFATKRNLQGQLVSLNLSPGIVNCTQVLEALVSAIPIESAAVMQYASDGPYALSSDPGIWEDYRHILAGAGFTNALTPIERFEFYAAASAPDVALTIATAEQRIYANLLLTIGVVFPDRSDG